MNITSLLLWVQESKLSEKFYTKLGFEVKESNDSHSVVSLPRLDVQLVSMRDEDKFSRDSMSAEKGLGMYIYINVDDVDEKFKELISLGFNPATKPKDWEWGNREFILKDPDRYKLCFWSKK